VGDGAQADLARLPGELGRWHGGRERAGFFRLARAPVALMRRHAAMKASRSSWLPPHPVMMVR
jgi:hypothetical protein